MCILGSWASFHQLLEEVHDTKMVNNFHVYLKCIQCLLCARLYIQEYKQTHFILTTAIGGYDYHAHFTEGETETKRGKLAKATKL